MIGTVEITKELTGEAPRQMSRELADFIFLKFGKMKQDSLKGELFTSAPTLRRAVKDGFVNDLLLLRMVKHQAPFPKQKELEIEAQKHFDKGVNGIKL